MAEGIAYQGKDIEFKILSENYKNKSFEAYGITLPKIKEVLPTNLPRVSANEKRLDNLFLLEDGTLAIIDYESEDKFSNRVKYINYIARVVEKYFNDSREIKDLRMIVIYTGDIQQADGNLDTRCFSLRLEQVFLSHLKGEEIYQTIKGKIERKENLTDVDLMRLIILPLAEKGKQNKQKRIEQVIELAKQVADEQEQVFVITGVLVNSDNYIDEEYSERIRRWLKMTKVFRLFEEEKQDAVNVAVKKTKKELTENLLRTDMEMSQIMQVTGLTRDEVMEIEKNMTATV